MELGKRAVLQFLVELGSRTYVACGVLEFPVLPFLVELDVRTDVVIGVLEFPVELETGATVACGVLVERGTRASDEDPADIRAQAMEESETGTGY